MSLQPADDLTPRGIVAELDRYIIGQNDAKRAVAVALRNRTRRLRLPEGEREDVMPKNILMIGPTGVGKTEIARRLASLARAPFVKVEATKFTEVGYVGRDVESMIRDLVATAVRMVEKERADAVQDEAKLQAEERLVDLIAAQDENNGFESYETEEDWDVIQRKREERREVIRAELKEGKHDLTSVEFDVEEANSPFLQVFTPGGMEEMGMDMNPLTSPFGSKRVARRATVREAMDGLVAEEANKLVDRSSVHREAVTRAEESGIVFLDEIDKVAGKSGGSGPDVSREGVQRDLLPVIEGSTVQTKFGPVRTEHILFIAAGAFHISKPSDLIPELQGRLPIRVQLESLGQGDFRRILSEPRNALTRQYAMLLKTEGVDVSFEDSALDEIARLAHMVNSATDDIGARRLATMMERLLQDVLFDAPETAPPTLVFDAAMVRERLEPFVANLERAKMLV